MAVLSNYTPKCMIQSHDTVTVDMSRSALTMGGAAGEALTSLQRPLLASAGCSGWGAPTL